MYHNAMLTSSDVLSSAARTPEQGSLPLSRAELLDALGHCLVCDHKSGKSFFEHVQFPLQLGLLAPK